MDICSGCHDPLHDSVVAEVEGKIYKSCPSCSVAMGQHVFYRYKDFDMKEMGNGRYIVQSCCPGCCVKDGHKPEVCFTC
ncbi:hypothetical protein [Photorhabdus luminescens]|uniref:Uncharacterized protein n=1 Tax=Photorhabdus luminescens subsp. mexicana TaxID=2100167 RepID=A0A4R4JG32_PHOLU|nr:hypothetical protein [Photorhabdus luminescens]MCW7763231.1 hypothetical protein [Photorhabdus luminescens subsp. venezuelensis]TDB52903.1 hypothetical protein C5468_08110 [Photorhabdus luminescens subsp. mexicana]